MTWAFSYCFGLKSITIPKGLTHIAQSAFADSGLTNIVIPSSVTSIGDNAFTWSTSLQSISIPMSVTSIGYEAFAVCRNLKSAYFEGDRPLEYAPIIFDGADAVTVYYLAGTTGWEATFSGRPTVLWNPQVSISDSDFGIKDGKFGFNIKGNNGIKVLVEACDDLSHSLWIPTATNVLAGGASSFSDSEWADHPSRVYRFHFP